VLGGFFDGQTTHEQRRHYLLTILDSTSTPDNDSTALQALTAAQLNSLIARGDKELQMLQDRDIKNWWEVSKSSLRQLSVAQPLVANGREASEPLSADLTPTSAATCQEPSLDRRAVPCGNSRAMC